MFRHHAPRIGNMALRALAMGSRFVLLFALSKFLEPAEVGLFGLLLATLSFCVLVIGGDYYAYSLRELLSSPRERWSFVLQHQALAIGVLYFLLLPPLLLVFRYELLPDRLIPWFFSLLVVEHLAQEINRLLVAMHHPLIASWVLFIRMGAWIWILLPILWLFPDLQSLETVYWAWLLGGTVAVVIGLSIIGREAAPWRRWPLDSTWLRRGFRTGLLFLTASLCLKALLTADRYVVKYLAGPDLLGVYVVYAGMAMTVVHFLDPAVFSFLYPRVVGAYRQGDIRAYHRVMREMTLSAAGFGMALLLAVAISAPFVFQWIGRSVYLEHMSVFWMLLGVAVVYAVGMIPHYALYAKGADRSILIANVSSLAVFTATIVLAAHYAPFEAAAYGLLAAFTWMGIFKYARYRLIV